MKVRVGLGSCGIAAGALKVWDELGRLQKSSDYRFEKIVTGCNGRCHLEPLVDIITDEERVYSYGQVDASKLKEILRHHYLGKGPISAYLAVTPGENDGFMERQVKVALRNCGQIDPTSLRDYIIAGGYQGLRKAIAMNPEELITEIKTSGLKGRGGAGFPTWFKWQQTRRQPGEDKYVVCNADEGDPGAFMDRSILEGDPHVVLEGMAIAAYAIGASQGVIYCRAEYPLAIQRLSTAIQSAYEAGYLGQQVLNSDFSFSIRIQQGAGAFVCGEETALIASLQGERGLPRPKPPYPSTRGYWGQPTNINNVETFANVPWIIRKGGSAFAALGTANSTGTKVFALAGKVKRGGLVEVPMGITLREVIYEIGGGVRNGRFFKAVQLGGPAGGCIPEAYLNTPIDYQGISNLGAIMGSGGMIVVDDTTCMVDLARYFLEFTQKESCGQCVSCRIGTKRMLEIMERICAGRGQPEDIGLLEELSQQVKETSLCGLGQGAPNPVLTTLRYFREEYEAHIHDKKCPAKHCKALIQYHIDAEKCTGCTICARKCPVQCIIGEKRQPHYIEQDKCTRCGTCLEVCPSRFDAVRVD